MYLKKTASIIFLVAFAGIASAQLAGFTLNGNPQSANGATWTFQDTVEMYGTTCRESYLNQPPEHRHILLLSSIMAQAAT